jgi:hypothetical protein
LIALFEHDNQLNHCYVDTKGSWSVADVMIIAAEAMAWQAVTHFHELPSNNG